MVDPHEDFEALWHRLRREISVGDTIRNWTRDSGYLGDEFTIYAVEAGFIKVDSPEATNIQHIPREDFENVYRHWCGYHAGCVLRSQIRDMTRFSKYIISILHHLTGA